jgi:hypothetical protein
MKITKSELKAMIKGLVEEASGLSGDVIKSLSRPQMLKISARHSAKPDELIANPVKSKRWFGNGSHTAESFAKAYASAVDDGLNDGMLMASVILVPQDGPNEGKPLVVANNNMVNYEGEWTGKSIGFNVKEAIRTVKDIFANDLECKTVMAYGLTFDPQKSVENETKVNDRRRGRVVDPALDSAQDKFLSKQFEKNWELFMKDIEGLKEKVIEANVEGGYYSHKKFAENMKSIADKYEMEFYGSRQKNMLNKRMGRRD